MATFSDLVLAAQPSLFPGGVIATVTEGRTWLFEFQATATDGTTIDLTGTTGECTVYAEDGTTLTTIPVTGGVGELTLRQDDTATQGLANGSKNGRTVSWECSVTDGTDSAQVWGSFNSRLIINPA